VKDDLDDEKVRKRIAKAEKKATRLAGVDQGLIHHFWELVNMFPKISTPELELRVEHFIMTAAPGQMFLMQQAIFEEATPYLLEDERVRHVMCQLSGKQIGLAITGEYESTVTLDGVSLKVNRAPGLRGRHPPQDGPDQDDPRAQDPGVKEVDAAPVGPSLH
jgi:hypothetical protein